MDRDSAIAIVYESASGPGGIYRLITNPSPDELEALDFIVANSDTPGSLLDELGLEDVQTWSVVIDAITRYAERHSA